MTSAPQRTESAKAIVPQELVQLLQSCSNDLTDATAKLVTADWCAENGYESLEKLLRWLVKSGDWVGCFTGSRCYGTPKPESDFDWVIYLNNQAFQDKILKDLRAVCDEDCCSEGNGYKYPSNGRLESALRFGPVNLIVVFFEHQWQAWLKGTQELLEEAPVTRDRAVAVFQREYRKALRLRDRMDDAGIE